MILVLWANMRFVSDVVNGTNDNSLASFPRGLGTRLSSFYWCAHWLVVLYLAPVTCYYTECHKTFSRGMFLDLMLRDTEIFLERPVLAWYPRVRSRRALLKLLIATLRL